MDWMGVVTETAAVVLAAAITAAVGWIARSIRDLRRDIAAFQDSSDARLDAVEQKLVRVEEIERHDVIRRLGDLETSHARFQERCLKGEDLTRVHKRVDDLTKEVHSMVGRLGSVDKSLGRIHDYLLARGD